MPPCAPRRRSSPRFSACFLVFNCGTLCALSTKARPRMPSPFRLVSARGALGGRQEALLLSSRLGGALGARLDQHTGAPLPSRVASAPATAMSSRMAAQRSPRVLGARPLAAVHFDRAHRSPPDLRVHTVSVQVIAHGTAASAGPDLSETRDAFWLKSLWLNMSCCGAARRRLPHDRTFRR